MDEMTEHPSYQHNTLAEAETTLHAVLDIISEGVWDWSAVDGRVIRSPGWYRMLGYPLNCFEQSVITWENIIHPDDYPKVMRHFEDYLSGKIDSYLIQYRCKKADGSYLWIEDSGKILARQANGQVLRMMGAHRNIHPTILAQHALEQQNKLLKSDNSALEQLIEQRTQALQNLNLELEKKASEAQHQASHDLLTGIYNRRCFEELFLLEVSRFKRYHQPLSLLLFDIDDFKKINDSCGHKVGDKILQELTQLVGSHLRENDILARWGGEEFIIILPNTESEQAEIKAENLRELIEHSLFNDALKVTCSFGVSEFKPEDTPDIIFSRVDKALYQAKELNRNNVQVA